MRDRKKLIMIILAIVVAVSSIFIYKGAIAPKLYDKYLNTGIKYLMNGQYEEAILAFDKAIKIEPKTTEARVYQAKAYVGNEELDKAVEVLEETQNIDKTNEELLKQILEILNEIDSDIAYEFLDRFIDNIGEANISQDIKDMLNSSNETPSEPIVDPAPGKYIKPISVKLKLDKIKLGHNYYYTLDGTHPNKGSEKYRGPIDISKSTTIKLIGYNKKGESTDVITLEYIIDENIINDIESIIEESEEILNNTEVGIEVGNVSEEDKNKFNLTIEEIKNLLNEDLSDYEDAKNMKNKIEKALQTFKGNIIKPTDKSKLKKVINDAQSLYNNSTEGNSDGQYKSGSKTTLLKYINEAKKINDDKLSKQDKIDSAVKSLNNAINTFKNSKVLTFTKEKALQYAINKFEKPFKDQGYFNDFDKLNSSSGDAYMNTWDLLESRYGSKRNKLALNEYKFKSGMLTNNGKRYYIIENYSNYYLEMHVYTFEIKVYEDGTVKYEQTF